MKLPRYAGHARLGATLALAGLLAVAACGSDNPSGSAGTKASTSSAASSISCARGSLTGAGSTAQQNAVDQWVKTYQERCPGATINYQGVGSGAGIQQFIQGTVDWAGSDSALKPEEHTAAAARCKTGPAIDLPMVVGPIAVAYNLPGVDGLQLRPATLAQIFTGKIKRWNDPAIEASNGGASLPATPIQAFHRADSSGTTDNFTKFLGTAAASDWAYPHAKTWPSGVPGQGAPHSDGVTSAVRNTRGAIAYVEYSFAQNSSLQLAKIANGSGAYVALTAASASKAAGAAQVAGTGADLTLKIDYKTPAAGAYPIILVTYEIVCAKGTPAGKLALLKSFLTYTSSPDGQRALNDLGYAPLPEQIRTKAAAAVRTLA